MCGTVPGSNQPSSDGAPPRALFVASAVFLSIFFATFLLVMALAFCCCRRRGRTGPDHAVGGGGGAHSDEGGEPFPVETLPTFVYGRQSDGRGGAAGGGRECAVCLAAVQEGEMVRRLPVCMHVYHVECIDRWLTAHRTCPLCRSELDPCKVASETLPAVQEDPPEQLPV